MANYKISDTTLTSIGDALRRKHGESSISYVTDTVESSFDIYELPLSSYGNSSAITKNIWLQLKKSTDIKFVYNANIENARIRISGFDRLGTIIGYEDLVNGDNEISVYSDDMCVMIQITFNRDDYTNNTAVANYSGTFYFYKNDELLTKEVATLNTYKPGEMAQAIDDIPPAPTEQELIITGNCKYRFANGGWDWVINKYGDKITTKDITYTDYMFQSCNATEIPFDINIVPNGSDCQYMFQYAKIRKIPSIDFKHTTTYHSISNMFAYTEAREIGTIKNLYPADMSSLFQGCRYLRYLPKFEGLNLSKVQTYQYCSMTNFFSTCYSLRKVPQELLNMLYCKAHTAYYYSFMNNLFTTCVTLDEAIGINPTTGIMTSNCFSSTVSNCNRLKDFIFMTKEDGQPYVAQWKSQTIDMATNVGWVINRADVLNYNSGITADKEVVDDATYQALKDNPDWFTCKIEYSRYNHDSAVATINSLPDTSAYLATAGGTNTIKFKGEAGSLTDGGAINTLTEEEIAVAASKGWTVSFA